MDFIKKELEKYVYHNCIDLCSGDIEHYQRAGAVKAIIFQSKFDFKTQQQYTVAAYQYDELKDLSEDYGLLHHCIRELKD